jgi:hypothetical protein
MKSIEAQMMITRLPDNVNQVSSLIKRPEVAQEFLAMQAKINDAHNQEKVARTLESEMEAIRTDVDGSSQNAYESDGGDRSGFINVGNAEDDPDMLVPPENHIIDIKI